MDFFVVPLGILAVVLVVVGLGLWLASPRFSRQEEDFASYVQAEAKKRNLRKEDVDGFLFTNFDILSAIYASQHGGLVLINVPALKRRIRDTY